MTTIDDVIALYQDYHWPDELRMMNKLASQVKDGVIVAIGSYRGQMDCALAMDATVPVYAVDPRYQMGTHYGDCDRPFWMQNVLKLGLAEKIRPVNLSSIEAARVFPHLIDLLFVDGDHGQVIEDLAAWLPCVSHESLIALHDVSFGGVQAAIMAHPEFIEVERADATIVYGLREVNV